MRAAERGVGQLRRGVVTDKDHPSAGIKIGDVTMLQSRAAGDGAVPIPWREAGVGEKWALVRLGWPETAFLQTLSSAESGASLVALPLLHVGLRGRIEFTGGPYGVSDDRSITLVYHATDPDIIEFTHATLAERAGATPTYEVAYKDHGGNNKYLHRDACGHVIGWVIQDPS